MKRVLLLTLALLAFGAAKAQFSAGDFVYGAKAGLNMSTMSNWDVKNKTSVHAGAFFEWRVLDFLGISPEIVYSRQGARQKLNGIKYRYRMNYLNIPVLAKIYVWRELSVDAGLQFGFNLNARMVTKSGNTTTRDKVSVNTFDMSFPIGLSCSSGDFVVSARYNVGLTNVTSKAKNNVFQLSVGYYLCNLF